MTTTTAPNPRTHDLTIHHHTTGPKGLYYGAGHISLRRDLGPINHRCTLAHETAHHTLDHNPNATGIQATRQEHAADRLAAQWLITETDYREIEALYGPDTTTLAHHLAVTHHLINVWRNLHT